MRIEPPASVPTAVAPKPAATAAAAPPEEPPGVLSRFHGLRVTPVSGLMVTGPVPYSGTVFLPRMTAPPSRSRATAAQSSAAGRSSDRSEPQRVGMPATFSVSLTVSGTPSTGPSADPAAQRPADASAAARAPASSRWQTALTRPLWAAMRAHAASSASTGEKAPEPNPATSSVTGIKASSLVMAISSCGGGVGAIMSFSAAIATAIEAAARASRLSATAGVG